jgi:hypothetical protein
MRRVLPVLCLSFLFCTANPAQEENEERESSPNGSEESAAKLPVRRVVLYKNGVGYFEHLGRVRGSQDVHIDFTSAQLNDVLKSLTVSRPRGRADHRRRTIPKRHWRDGWLRCGWRWESGQACRNFSERCAVRGLRCAPQRAPR